MRLPVGQGAAPSQARLERRGDRPPRADLLPLDPILTQTPGGRDWSVPSPRSPQIPVYGAGRSPHSGPPRALAYLLGRPTTRQWWPRLPPAPAPAPAPAAATAIRAAGARGGWGGPGLRGRPRGGRGAGRSMGPPSGLAQPRAAAIPVRRGLGLGDALDGGRLGGRGGRTDGAGGLGARHGAPGRQNEGPGRSEPLQGALSRHLRRGRLGRRGGRRRGWGRGQGGGSGFPGREPPSPRPRPMGPAERRWQRGRGHSAPIDGDVPGPWRARRAPVGKGVPRAPPGMEATAPRRRFPRSQRSPPLHSGPGPDVRLPGPDGKLFQRTEVQSFSPRQRVTP